MKKLVKGLVALLLAVVMAFSLVACADDNDKGNNNGNNNGGEQTQKIALSEVFAKTAANLAKKDSLHLKINTLDYNGDADKYDTVNAELKLKKNDKSFDMFGGVESTFYYLDSQNQELVEAKDDKSFYLIDGMFFMQQVVPDEMKKVYERQYDESISMVLDALFGAAISESELKNVFAEYISEEVVLSDNGYTFSIDKDFAKDINSIFAKIKENGDKTIAEFIAAMASNGETVVTAEQVNALIASVLNDEVTIAGLVGIIDGVLGGDVTVKKIVDGIAGAAGFSAADLREKLVAIPEIPSLIIPAVGVDDTLYTYFMKFVGQLPVIEVIRMFDPTIASLDDYYALINMVINSEALTVKSLFDSIVGGLIGIEVENLFDTIMSITFSELSVNFGIEIDKDFNLKKLSGGIKVAVGSTLMGNTAGLTIKDLSFEVEIDYGTVSEIRIPDDAIVLPHFQSDEVSVSELVQGEEFRVKVLNADGYKFSFNDNKISYDMVNEEIVFSAEKVDEILASGIANGCEIIIAGNGVTGSILLTFV